MEKNSRHDLDLDQIMPNVELARAIFIYYNMFKWIEPLFFYQLSVIMYTDRQSHTQLDRPTDGHEYFIVVVDKPQL